MKKLENRKAFVGYLTYFLIAFFIMCIGIGIIYTQNSPQQDILNVTSQLKWKEISPSEKQMQNSSIINIVYKITNAIGYSAFEVAREGVKWGAEHPETNWKLLIWLTFIAILSPIIISLVKLFAIIFIFIKDLIQSRRERKRIKHLRDLRNE